MSATLAPPSPDAALEFDLPRELEAGAPPARRDAVRLLVATADGRLAGVPIRRLPEVLDPGDLLVVNTSATVPAALPGHVGDGREVLVHLSTHLPDGTWLVELRRPDGAGSTPLRDTLPGEVVALPGRRSLHLLAPHADHPRPARIWRAWLDPSDRSLAYLHRHGRPIRYRHAAGEWPLDAYQTVYAREPGSAEMPSAGRAFTHRLLARLALHGIGIAPLVLHTGVSSLEAAEPPLPEPYVVPADTARRVRAARAAGHRVVAVGTSVVRALESAADADGFTHAAGGWTDLVLGPERGVRAVDALLTGWHEPRSSHLALLEAVAGRELVACSYETALRARYRWHEFGDLLLLLP